MLMIAALLILSFTLAFSATGTLHLIYSNGQTVKADGVTYYDFDVQMWLSEGSEIVGSGMAYVEYPEAIFGKTVVMNGNVTAELTGILGIRHPEIQVNLYDIYTNDTFADCFAITFEAIFAGLPNMELFYEQVSADSLAPSDLLHIRLTASAPGTGNVLFPTYIPGKDNLYYNYYNETFSGGLDISEAYEYVEIAADTTVPGPEGSVQLKSLTASWKKSSILIKWSTLLEVDMAGYNVLRSEDGVNFTLAASYVTDPSLIALNAASARYQYSDAGVVPGTSYLYKIEGVDVYDNTILLGTVQVGDDLVYTLGETYPNPFNPSFVVPFELYEPQNVSIRLYNMAGQAVRNIAGGVYAAGNYEFHVDCNDLSSGVYFLRALINGQTSTQKMLLVK
ncbi:MAG: T9SS type A sorting domain-containing protein [Candidatus Marinimicrobia bacterium]|nr:T9SS type A sorting domain-containing protein [Candidatus Neomarinimicrobiota bacterium]